MEQKHPALQLSLRPEHGSQLGGREESTDLVPIVKLNLLYFCHQPGVSLWSSQTPGHSFFQV